MLMLVPPFVGHWSDIIGRTPIMRGVAVAVLFAVLPAFLLLMSVPTLLVIVAVLMLIGGLKASYSAALPALMAEIFPTRTRSTGMNLSYNIGVTVFGGLETFFATLTKRRLKRGAFRSVVDLQAAINRYLDEANHDPKPFTWTADPDKIIAAVTRGRQALESIH